GPDRPGLAVRGGPVGEQGDVRLARRDVPGGVRGVELIRAAADRSGVHDPRGDAEVLGDREALHPARLAGVVDGVDVRPGEPGILQRSRPALRLDLQRAQAAGRSLLELVDAGDGRGRCRHADATDASAGPRNRTRPRSMTTVPSSVAVWNRALPPPSSETSSSSQMETTSVSPGRTGRVNRPDIDANRAGSEPHSACSSARPVTP